MRKIIFGAIALALSVSSACAQSVNGGAGQTVNGQPVGGSGGGSGNANFGTATGNTANNFVGMADTTTGVKDLGVSSASFAPAGVVSIVTGSNPTTNAASWLAFTQYTIAGSGRTITVPASSGLSTNGGLDIDANTNSVTLTANAADTITWAGATTGTGGSVTLPAGSKYTVTTDAAGKLYVSGRAVQGNGLKTQLSTGSTTTNNCVKFDANGNTVDAGSACGGTFTPILPNYIANNWYLAQPYTGLSTPGALGSTTTVYMPFMVNKALTLSAIGTKLITASSGQNCRLYVYAGNATTNKPTGSALADSGNLSTTTAGNISGTISLALTANTLYFAAAQCSDATAALEGFGITSDSLTGYLIGANAQSSIGSNGGQIGTGYTSTSTYGTGPTNPTITIAGSNGSTLKNFIVMFKVGSVP